MGKKLERDLNLYAITTISMGAMIGSGIFVLPGLASKIAGPAVIIAYFLAGLIVIPSALSKAELATAMPESGGTYLFIDRAMGPLFGTIAGIGAWFSLVFKSAFALVGLGAYLILLIAIPSNILGYVAIGLALLILFVNSIGVKQTGRLQSIVVTLVLLVLAFFIADGLTYVSRSHYHPFFEFGTIGVLQATGFVFVSYAGVTKIASVAEEVSNPGRNIPISIIFSITFMMLVYTLVVFVIVGVAPLDQLGTSLTPMALAANQFLGRFGEIAIAVVAVLALASMANAGVLSSTRYPLAMSRDSLMSPHLSKIHKKFNTPIYSIGFTGIILILLIAFIPVFELAKLASAFQILVFIFINIALIAFRESDIETYNPEFKSPFYPWVQIFGILGGVLLLTQMGLIPFLGSLFIVIGGYSWYKLYGESKTSREGVALDSIRRISGKSSVLATKKIFATGGEGGIIVATEPGTSKETNKTLLRIANTIIPRTGGKIKFTRFETFPDQLPLSMVVKDKTEADELFHNEINDLIEELNAPSEVEQVVSHNLKNSIRNYVKEEGLNLVIGEWEPKRISGELFGYDVDWFMKNLNSDIIFVRDQGFDNIKNITVIGEKGPYSPLELLVADALGTSFDAKIRFLHVVKKDINHIQVSSINDYHEEIKELFNTNTEHEVLETDDLEHVIKSSSENTDLVITSTSSHHFIHDVLFGTLPDKIMRYHDCTVILIHSNEPRRHTFLRYILEKIAYD